MFGPWIEIWGFLKGLWPGQNGWRLSAPNFLIIHYCYMIGLTILGSILLYPTGGLKYVDALFFAAGSATQSGLNTVNINNLNLSQQVIFMLMACIANPIFINTFVVFVRLYWFEKRFQNIVLEAQKFRRTRTKDKSRTNTEAKEDRDLHKEELGVGDRKITRLNSSDESVVKAVKLLAKEDVSGSSSKTTSNKSKQAADEPTIEDDEDFDPAPPKREITFGDELLTPVERTETELARLPVQKSAADHIAFLENQRNPKDTDTLYIPGPRDFDRGFVPQAIDHEHDTDAEKQQRAHFAELPHRTYSNDDDRPEEGAANRNHVSIYSPTHASNAEGKRRRLGFTKKSESHMAGEEQPKPKLIERAATFKSFLSTRSEDEDPMPYLSWQATIGRNSQFVDLNERQREELGGIEYRALKLLALILVLYFIGFHIVGMLCFLPWIKNSGKYTKIVVEDGINPGWWAVFTSASMFNDLGFTLTPDSMLSFNEAIWPLLIGSFFIIIGNTGFPCMLRFVIWTASLFVPKGTAVWEELRFLLDHPRRCFTLLFPGKATWWLFWVLVLLNGVDLVFFIILDLNDKIVTSLPAGIRVLDGWFQAASTRTAGFGVVNLAELHPGIQVSYLIMMYISVFPIAISVRRTNVYEEKSLGIWEGDTDDDNSNEQSYIGSHLRRQLSFDLWYVFLGLFLICVIEGRRIQNRNDYAFTIFTVLFEIVSAYGTVGLSLGYPGIDASFSAELSTLSKLIVIAMMIRGRHRGLPYALDRAILLPSESLNQKEQAEAERRARRRSSALSTMLEHENENLEQLVATRENAEEVRKRKNRGGLARLISSGLGTGPVSGKKLS